MLFLDLSLLKVLIREDPIPNECYSVILLTIYFRNIFSVDLVKGLFKVKYDFTKTWNDHNVNFMNLKKSKANFLRDHDSAMLWQPYIVFFNIEGQERIVISDKKPIIYVQPNPDFVYQQSPQETVKIMNCRSLSWTNFVSDKWQIFSLLRLTPDLAD